MRPVSRRGRKKPARARPRPRSIGFFGLGSETVELFARGGMGGEFYFQPDESSLPRIKIGLSYRYEREVLDTLIHEAGEFLLLRNDAGYAQKNHHLSGDSNDILFVLVHTKWSHIASALALFLLNAWPALRAVWAKNPWPPEHVAPPATSRRPRRDRHQGLRVRVKAAGPNHGRLGIIKHVDGENVLVRLLGKDPHDAELYRRELEVLL